jgi:cytosine deaminase
MKPSQNKPLLLRGGRPWGGDVHDLLVQQGVIAAPGSGTSASDATVLDLDGGIVLPGLVDAHCHVDKTLWGGSWVPHSAGSELKDRIRNDRERRGELRLPDPERIGRLLEQMVVCGTTHIRTHTDIDPDLGLRAVETVATVAEKYADLISVEQVAFPQHGLMSNPGTLELIEAALGLGATLIGGIDPAGVDRDPVAQLDAVFDMAARHGAGIDIHLHDEGTLGAWQCELIAERTLRYGLHGRVTISHAFCLGQVSVERQDQLASLFAEADISLTTAALYSLPFPPYQQFRAAGVNLACGSDGIRDLWGPFGNGDMLQRAMHLAYRAAFRRDEELARTLDAVTTNGARLMRLTRYGLEPGDAADLVVIPAASLAEAVVSFPTRSHVVRAGRVVARDGQLVHRPTDHPPLARA